MLKLGIIASFLVVCCLGAAPRLRRPHLDGRIVGGRDADISEVPYQLSFEYGGSHMCGASILSVNWVVTTGNCADGVPTSNVRFRAGSSKRGSGGSLHQASQVIVHPQFDYYNNDYDVAVIKNLRSSRPQYGRVRWEEELNDYGTSGLGIGRIARFLHLSPSNYVQPISLTSSEPSTGTIATVSGWGSLGSGGSLPTQLQLVTVPVVDRDACNRAYAAYGGITENMICAGLEEGGKDSCHGDTGGPLVTEGKLSGVVSWGYGCASPGKPGVYSSIASLRSFITFNTNGN